MAIIDPRTAKGRGAVLTMYEACAVVKQVDALGKAYRTSPSVVHGRVPAPSVSREPGHTVFTPEELLSLRLERYVPGKGGYQRLIKTAHVRRNLVSEIVNGAEMDRIRVGIDPSDGALYIVNGQQRAAASIITWQPLRASVDVMTYEQRAAEFANQGKQAKQTADQEFLAGTLTPLRDYIEDAITSPIGTHPWANKVAEKSGGGKMGAAAAAGLIAQYCANAIGPSVYKDTRRVAETFDRDLANELSMLIGVWDRTASPFAYASVSLRAITICAVKIVRRSENHARDVERWMKHMPRFNFAVHQHLRHSTQLAEELMKHWNSRLPADRKVVPVAA